MFERLTDKTHKPTTDAFLLHMGDVKDAFKALDKFLTNTLNAQSELKLDAHSRCWKVSYHGKRKYLGDLISEKDALTVVTRLPEAWLRKATDTLSPYAKNCIESSPYYCGGWV